MVFKLRIDDFIFFVIMKIFVVNFDVIESKNVLVE